MIFILAFIISIIITLCLLVKMQHKYSFQLWESILLFTFFNEGLTFVLQDLIKAIINH